MVRVTDPLNPFVVVVVVVVFFLVFNEDIRKILSSIKRVTIAIVWMGIKFIIRLHLGVAKKFT